LQVSASTAGQVSEVLGKFALELLALGLLVGGVGGGVDGAVGVLAALPGAVGFGGRGFAFVLGGDVGNQRAGLGVAQTAAEIVEVAGVGEMLVVGAEPPADVDRAPSAGFGQRHGGAAGGVADL
jgi:hypothetical protein